MPASFLRICITGGIACGKSLVGEILAEQGVPVREADDVCHELMTSDVDLRRRLIDAFGRDIVTPDGGIDRQKLGQLVFVDPDRLVVLNRLVHPPARRAIASWMAQRQAEAASQAEAAGRVEAAVVTGCGWRGGAAAVVPLVYEAEWENNWDWIVCVGSPAPLQIERLKIRGLSEKEARSRLAAQLPVEEKMRRAHSVIFNTGTRQCVRRQTEQWFHNLINQRESSYGRKI